MPLTKQFLAELIGTFWLVFGGCGSAVLAGVYQTRGGIEVGIGLHGIALAFGLTVLTMAYAIGHISGCHLNPSRSPPGGLCLIWILGFANNRLTIADFRDVRILAV